MKLNRISKSFSMQVTHSFQSFTKRFSYLIAWWFGDGFKWKVDCLQMFQIRKRRGMFALILNILFILFISNMEENSNHTKQ